MATQTVEFLAVYGQTLTAKLYAVGSDALVQTASVVTEQTNRIGVYRATFTDAAAGEYELHVATSGGVPVARWYVTLTLTTATFATYDGPAKLAAITHTGARIPNVTLVDTTTVNTDMRGTDGALLASSYTAPLSASETRTALGLASANLDTQLADLPTVSEFEARTLTTANYANATNQTAIKTVTDKLNTGLVLDGAVYQFTANMLELAPGGGGGGSATIENQELILANLDDITGAVSAAVARLQLETQITGFPATICRGSDYDTTLESEIRLQLLDLNNAPITEIGGTPVAEITWLFGLGTDRQPRLVAGACSWDGTTDELVIELAATDTNTTPLGSVTWQIGAQIGELIRWLGGGTTRIVERQFAA